MTHFLLFFQISILLSLSSVGQVLPVIKNENTKNKITKVAKPKKSLAPKISSSIKHIDGYYEYYPVSEKYLYSGLIRNGNPHGHAYIYSKIDTSLLYEGLLNNGNYQPDDIEKKVGNNAKGYEYYLKQGEQALQQDKKELAISAFKKVSLVLGSEIIFNSKCKEIIAMAIQNGDKLAGADEFQTALSWYLIAQSLNNNSTIQKKINYCKAKL